MKLTIEVPDEHINGALAAPHSRYWADSAQWDPTKRSGKNGQHAPIELNSHALKTALCLMATVCPRHFSRLMAGEYDGVTGDILLQLMAFGELRYG